MGFSASSVEVAIVGAVVGIEERKSCRGEVAEIKESKVKATSGRRLSQDLENLPGQ
jgi:hypothetical protein